MALILTLGVVATALVITMSMVYRMRTSLKEQ